MPSIEPHMPLGAESLGPLIGGVFVAIVLFVLLGQFALALLNFRLMWCVRLRSFVMFRRTCA